MKITLFHLPNSRSQRIIWLFEELHIGYDLQCHGSKSDNNKNNAMKYPRVELFINNKKQILTESSAIAEYFSQYTQQLLIPLHHEHFWDFTFYKNYNDASLMPNLALKQIFQHITQHTPWLFRWISYSLKYAFNRSYLNPELNQQLKQLAQHLKIHTWLAGDDFSYADILLWFPLQAAVHAHPNFQTYTALEQYLKRIQDRPSFQSALIRGEWSEMTFQKYWKITQ